MYERGRVALAVKKPFTLGVAAAVAAAAVLFLFLSSARLKRIGRKTTNRFVILSSDFRLNEEDKKPFLLARKRDVSKAVKKREGEPKKRGCIFI